MNWKKKVFEQAGGRGYDMEKVEELIIEWEEEYIEPPSNLDELIVGVLE
jgi:hypothetical protein